MKHLTLLALALLCSFIAATQQNSSHLYLDAFATPDSLILRWATDSPGLYNAGRANGYLLQKATANSTRFETIVRVNPLSQLEIEKVLQNHPEDEAALVAAQIQLTNLDSLYAGDSGILDGYQQHNNRMLALNFLNLSADLSGPAAEILGFRKVLHDYQPEEKAIYRIICLNEQQEGLDTAYHYHNAALSWLPPVNELSFEQHGTRLQVKWDYPTLSSFYTAYDLYRSDKPAGPYTKLNTHPIYTANEEAKFNFHFDTIAIGATGYYKVQGYSSFGMAGPFSPAFSYRMLDQKVGYTATKITAAGNHESIELSWEPQIAPGSNANLQGVRIFKSNQEAGTYRALHPGFLPTDTRSFTDTMIRDERMHFYRIVAYNLDEVEKSSSVIMADYVDTLAPAPPVGLFGYIDSLGVARIIWQPNRERDLEGYRVYTSNRPDGTYYHAHDRLHHSNEFTDTVGLKFLSKQVYYKVAAVDQNNNHSDYSELLIIERPDTIAPVAPRILHYQKTGKKLVFQISPSSSNDVAVAYLRRSCYGKIDTLFLRPNTRTYTDSLFFHLQGEIQYQIFAADEHGNESAGNTIRITQSQIAQKVELSVVVQDNRTYLAQLQHNLSAGDVLYLFIEADGQALQFLDRLDHSASNYTLPPISAVAFRIAGYVINRNGKKSPTYFSNLITRS